MDNSPFQPHQVPPPPLPMTMPLPPTRHQDLLPRMLGRRPQGGGKGPGNGGTWIMIGITAFVLCVGAVLIFSRARAVAKGGYVGPGMDTRDNRQMAAEHIAIARSQLVLYGLQHDNRLPDFVRYPNWEQLTQMTDRMGKTSGGTRKTGHFVYGPYLKQKPVNPLNGLSNVFIVVNGKAPASKLPAGKTAGFVLHTPTRRLFLTDVNGTRVLITDPQ